MSGLLPFLIGLLLLSVLAVLGTGVVAMLRGGDFNRKYGNKLMRLRVLLQFAAVILILLAMLASTA
ncbi:MAG: twin transmembrane helix small protein [Minwuiales bacterium]|nr:twin transmembrane helix small protein [Minwuiales bacterium]